MKNFIFHAVCAILEGDKTLRAILTNSVMLFGQYFLSY